MTKQNTAPKKARGARGFDPAVFLETAAKGRIISTHPKKQIIFAQGDAADAVIYIKKGKVKVTVVSKQGKEAVVAHPGGGRIPGRGMPDRTAEASGDGDRNDGMRDDAGGEGRDPAGASRRARILANVHLAYSGQERPGRRRPGRPALQLNRKAACPGAAAAGQFRQGGPAGADRRKDQPGDARRDDRHDAVARQPFHEQVSRPGLHRLQRPSRSPQLAVERGAERPAQHREAPRVYQRDQLPAAG